MIKYWKDEQQILENICDMMDRAGIPHNCDGDNLIEINEHYKIIMDKSRAPWRCTLFKDDTEIYSSNPTGIILMTKYKLARDDKQA